MATQCVIASRTTNENKVYLHELFESKDLIEKNVVQGIEERYKDAVRTACAHYIIENKRFGHFLAKSAEGILPGQKKQFLLASHNHMMALELRCANENKYIVRFYDPNLTSVAFRCAVQSLEQFKPESYELQRFLNLQAYKSYFTPGEQGYEYQECLIYACSDPQSPNYSFQTLETPS